jgi:predicted DNA-binding transcriptional regulator AlpA
MRLLDKEQLAAKLELPRTDLSTFLADGTFPKPAGYFRGRVLWQETAIDAWLHRPAEVDIDVVSASRAG